MRARWLLVLALCVSAAPKAEDPPDGARGILDEIARYDARLVELDTADAAMTARDKELRVALASHKEDEANAGAEVDHRRAAVQHGVRAAYRLQRRGFARLLFDARSPDELRRRVYYLLATVRAQQASMRAFGASVDARIAATAAATAELQSLSVLQVERDSQRESLKEERGNRVALLRSVRGSPSLSSQFGAETARARSEINAYFGPNQGSSSDDASVGSVFGPAVSEGGATVVALDRSPTAAPSGSDAFRSSRGALPWPLQGRVIIGWGPTLDPTTQETVQSTGLDIAAAPGTPFRAVFAGIVTRSGYVRGYGQIVIVEHGSYTTLYAHANGLRVSQGQEVKRGDVLGLVGSTGLLDDAQARLHFEVRYNGTPQDPREWLTPK